MMPSQQIERREFFKRGGAAALALSAASWSARSWAAETPAAVGRGPNDTLRVGVIGLRGRGKSHIHGLQAQEGVDVVGLCDVDEAVLHERATELETKRGRPAKLYSDLRQMLDNPEIDAVSIATPNHWHALAGIWAMQAGKDVYVEKPCSHNVYEGRQLVHAARKYERVCQHGTQARSSDAVREGVEKLREGVIGDVYMARGVCFKWRDSIGHTPDETPPPGVDYDLWLGPAPERAFSQNRFHYNWHWHWDYGNGDVGNQGVHEMDLARWGLGVGLPTKIQSSGGRFMFDDDKETPNTLVTTFEYPAERKLLVFEVRHWITNHEGFGEGSSNAVGVTFYGSEGFMRLRNSAYETFLGREREPGPAAKGSTDPFGAFVRAIRSRDAADNVADAEVGHLTSSLCHLANVAYRVGHTVEFDPETESCPSDEAAEALLGRDYRSPFIVPRIA